MSRIDAVLADLASGRLPADPATGAPAAGPARAEELAARRRRRRHRGGWVAAAAVIVAAGLGGTVVQRGGADSLTGSSPEAGSAGDAAVEDGAGQDGAVQDGGEVPRLGRARLLPQVRRLVRSPGEAPATAGGRAEACGAEVGPGDRTLAVSYAGAPAVLVVRAEPAGRTVVDLVVCGRSGIARSLTLGP